jgi:molecular chaperone HtpG
VAGRDRHWALGRELPRIKRILELNPEHALVTGLRTAHEANADDPALAEAAELLYGRRCSPRAASSPRFTRLLADRLARSL